MMQHTPQRPSAPLPRTRRGSGIAAIIVLLAVINIAAVGVISASTDESDVGATRLQSARALYAADSGAVVVLRLTQAGATLPATNSTLTLPNATATFQQVPGSTGGTLKVLGESGAGARRVQLVFTYN